MDVSKTRTKRGKNICYIGLKKELFATRAGTFEWWISGLMLDPLFLII